ncbi:glycerol-3-phosphate dehydrogenase [Glaciimonas immobilis]|uniref:Glycerol-3-phosphate dehydrogenase n=1 Tax=Glaciimonas immobilis TaxID=728004 RepID=A0A840RWL7_9BURK|nr:glycerol-3-phosphate dehydrogenase [Glaciimonas immobilis]KAF3997387.1 glycerol-3-phosphate dehydrogenase [Glaciimonas immobilis]MBB5200951.1 glycerol-3-phosphate dehydrogenase [Glaciimonas immobilis]
MSASEIVDLLVVGGGINGAGIARDAIGRGLSVLLCEQDDLAAHTSSASTKLIHGGLRYLEHYEFSLVRKALQEREVLLRLAPHIISPLRFVMPHVSSLRPAWMIRAGLFLYDHLSKRKVLPGSRGIDFRSHVSGAPLKKSFKKGFVYSDAAVQDARLVVLNAMDARERGATVMTKTRLIAARQGTLYWDATLQSTITGENTHVKARCVVNAAGPWVASLLSGALNTAARHHIRLVKGSHIVTKRLFDHDHAYIFQNPDKRIVFAIPYENDFTAIGTTDVEYSGDPAKVDISEEETAYLCESVNRYFNIPVSPSQVVWSWSGVRPLLEEEVANPSAVTRDYRLELTTEPEMAPVLSVFGGKITTYRRLAEEAMEKLQPLFSYMKAQAWTADAPLPGGDIENADFPRFLKQFQQRYAWLPAATAKRYAHAYGSRVSALLDGVNTIVGLGELFGADLYEIEVRYMMDKEWALTAEDIIWRRSKLGLRLDGDAITRLTAWLEERSAESNIQMGVNA